MRKKFILIIAIIAVVGIVSIYIWQSPTQLPSSNSQDVIFSFLVKGCAETDSGMAVKSSGEGEIIEQEPEIEIIGGKIIYSRAINHLCCRKAEIEKEIGESTINIYEVWSGLGCKCICFSEIEAEIENLPSETYTINVYEKGTDPTTQEPMEEKLIISRAIDLYS